MPCVQIIENEFECLADKRGLGSYLTYGHDVDRLDKL